MSVLMVSLCFGTEPCFRRPSTPAPSLNGVEYTVLFAKNCDVDAINNEKLSKLGGKCFT